MIGRGSWWAGRQARRLVQVLFLLLFLATVLWPRFYTSGEESHLAELFFHLDPLVLAATWLTTYEVAEGVLLALGVVLLTVLLGRVFCGWICPLGTIHAIAGWVCDRARINVKRRDHWSRWQLSKYYLLAAFLVMAAFGSHWGTIWDPLVLLYRSAATALLPGAQWAAEEVSTPLARSDNRVARAVSKHATEPAYEFLRDRVFGGVDRQRHAFLGGGLVLGVFIALVLANAYRRRFWCRYLCPLGALLGVLAWRPWIRRKTEEGCNQCDLCSSSCHGAAAAAPGQAWMPSECLGCLNCSDSCRRKSLGFTVRWPWSRQPAIAKVDLSKRALIGSAAGGLAAMMLLRITPQARGMSNPELIRPPGARPEREFLQRCLACGLCMQACPTGGLQPAVSEAGLEGLWTPRLVPQIGPCSYNCNLCGEICPTQAIARLGLEEKQQTKIGLATFDTSRCIPYAFGRECMVCEECCPIPDKAIYCVDVEVVDRNGEKHTIKRPYVDGSKCIGCGQCEKMCVYKDRPAIRVTSTNEARSPDQPLLSLDLY